jgi:heat shock protein HslJ
MPDAETTPGTSGNGELLGRIWELQQIQFNDDTRLVANPPENYTVTFLDGGELIIEADCNRARGNFTLLEDNRLGIMVGATTSAACPPGSISDDFLRSLNEANSYFLRDGNLFIELKLDTGTMQFSTVDNLALAGSRWQLQQILYNDGTLLEPDVAENYTVEFSGTDEVFVQADCNRAIGTYGATSDRQLSVEMGPTTLVACSETSIGGNFLQALNNSAIYFFQDGNLFIDLKFDSGTMTLTPL